jgi:hypothetical protein
MKYTSEIIINASLKDVVGKMNSADNMKHWQKGLVHVEHISGIPGTFGAKMKLHYDFGNRKMELLETITKQNLPHEIHTTYNTKGVQNIQQNYFESIDATTTKWTSVNEFQPTSFFMGAMLLLMPKSFKKQTAQYMHDFKNFVENDKSVCDD